MAHAATFVSENSMMDVWSYVFTVKTQSALMGTPLNVTEYMCNGPINHRTKEPLLPRGTVCYNSEPEARAAAQKEADKFEADKIANGESSTAIELKRQALTLKNKLTP